MRALAMLFLLFAVAGRSQAGAPPDDLTRTRAKLSGPDPRDIAWGLDDAVRLRLSGLDDEIRRVLDHHRAGAATSAVRSLALDAAIELDVDGLFRAVASDAGPVRALARGSTLALRAGAWAAPHRRHDRRPAPRKGTGAACVASSMIPR